MPSKAENETTPIVPTIDMLTAAANRFRDHAERIVNQAALDVAMDLRLAGRISAAYAHLRRGIADEAGRTHDPASAERLRGMLIEEL
jgi:hypothetical protein